MTDSQELNLNGSRNNSKSRKGRQRSRDFSTFPFTPRSLVMNHVPLANAFSSHFERFTGAVLFIFPTLQNARAHDSVVLVEEYVNALIDSAIQQLNEDKSRIESVLAPLKDKRLDIVADNSTAREVSVRISTSAIRRYVELYESINEYMNLIVAAEIEGAIRWNVKAKLLKEAPLIAVGVSSGVQRLATRMSGIDMNNRDKIQDVMQEMLGNIGVKFANPQPKKSADKRPVYKVTEKV